MNLTPDVMYFDSKQIGESNGIYGLIIKSALEENNLDLDDLKPLYMNRVPGAKISSWYAFKQTMVRVIEREGDMTWGTFQNWARILDIKVAASFVSHYGYELPEDGFVLDFVSKDMKTPVMVGPGHLAIASEENFYDEAPVEHELNPMESTQHMLEFMTDEDNDDEFFEDNSDSMEDDIEDELQRVHNFLEYSLSLAAFGIENEQDTNEVTTFLQTKLEQGMKFLNSDNEIKVISVVGRVQGSYLIFVVTALVDMEYAVTVTFDKKLY
jgi:hypothetical protein